MLNFWLVGFSYLNIGCNKNIPTTMYQPTHPGPSTHTSEAYKIKEIHSPNQQEYDFFVVLLHGSMGDSSCFNHHIEYIKSKFNKVLILASDNRALEKSITISIEGQLIIIFDAIKACLAQHSKDPKTFRLILVGHSQGGNLAVALAHKHRHDLNICGIYTLNAALKGTIEWDTIINATEQLQIEYEKLINYIGYPINIPMEPIPTRPTPENTTQESLFSSILEIISKQYNLSEPITPRSSDIINLAIILKIGNDFQLIPGISDLKPDSNHIKQVTSFLREETHDIPCRLVGSYVNNFGEMRNKNLIVSIASKLYPFQKTYAKIITKKEQGKHDGWLPLSTQLCRGESFEDLAIIGDSIQENNVFGKPHITAAIYKDMLHEHNIALIERSVDPKRSVLDSDTIADDLRDFIGKCLKTS